jgi:opacity protein-like surface antigen
MEKIAKNKGKKGNFKKAIATGAALVTLVSPVAYAANSSQKEKAPISLILEAGKGAESYSAGLGAKIGKIGLGIRGKKYSNKSLYDTEENVFGDVYFKGKKDLEKISYIGAFAEFYPSLSEKVSMVLGAGGGLKKGTVNIEEKLLRDGKELASNQISTLKKGFGWDVYAGLIFDITKNISAGPFAGYEKSSGEKELESDGFYAGIKLNLNIK